MTTRRSRKNGVAARSAITVRMYNVGFGDCFLIRIPAKGGERRILVDCGFHTHGKGMFKDQEIAAQIAKDLHGEGLHVVVATHRHQDHISGFSAKDAWKDVRVEEVWFPFTARSAGKDGDGDPAFADWNRLVRALPKLVDERGRLTQAATAALAASPTADPSTVAFHLWNARENSVALETLSNMVGAGGGAARKRYLPEGKALPETFETPVLPGVKVHVLGPPREAKYRTKMTLPGSWGVSPDGELVVEKTGGKTPFGPEWRLDPTRVSGRRPFIDRSLETIASFNVDLAEIAFALDGFLNGESVVLALEFGEAVLLFTGDAEVGAWTKILDTPAALEIASRATFLKVGHHGSENATPLLFLQKHLSRKAPAIISTQAGPGTFRNRIPRQELLTELAGRLARSDEPRKAPAPTFVPSKDGKWIDCTIPC